MVNKLTTRVDILVTNPQQDSCGGTSGLPLILYPALWAGIEDLTGKEEFTGQQFASQLNVKITVRKKALITSACLVRGDGKLYTIQYVRDPASATVSQAYRGTVQGQPRLLRGMYMELFCSLFNDQSAANAVLQQFAGPDEVVIDGGSF